MTMSAVIFYACFSSLVTSHSSLPNISVSASCRAVALCEGGSEFQLLVQAAHDARSKNYLFRLGSITRNACSIRLAVRSAFDDAN